MTASTEKTYTHAAAGAMAKATKADAAEGTMKEGADIMEKVKDADTTEMAKAAAEATEKDMREDAAEGTTKKGKAATESTAADAAIKTNRPWHVAFTGIRFSSPSGSV